MNHSTSPTLEICGYAKISLPPEIVTIKATLTEKNPRPEEALLGLARRVEKMIDHIKATDLPGLDVRTTSPGVEELTGFDDNDDEQHLGYSAEQTLFVTIDHTTEAFSRLTQAIVDSNTTPEISASYAIKDPAAIEPKLMALAVMDARQKADAIASASDHRVLGLQEARDAYSHSQFRLADRSAPESTTRPRLFSISGETKAKKSPKQPSFNSHPQDLVFQESLHCIFAMAW